MMSNFVNNVLHQMGCLLFFLSYKYNDEMPWNSPSVVVTLCLSIAIFLLFILVELLIAPEPVLAPFLLQQKVPLLIGTSNILVRISSWLVCMATHLFQVSMCNFSVMYFFPMFFETVKLTSASTAGTF